MNRYNIGSIFLTSAFCTLINPKVYIAIALWFFMIAIFLPITKKLTRNYFTWHQGGIKRAVVLASLLLFCSILPQVETNTAVFTSPIEDLRNELSA